MCPLRANQWSADLHIFSELYMTQYHLAHKVGKFHINDGPRDGPLNICIISISCLTLGSAQGAPLLQKLRNLRKVLYFVGFDAHLIFKGRQVLEVRKFDV